MYKPSLTGAGIVREDTENFGGLYPDESLEMEREQL